MKIIGPNHVEVSRRNLMNLLAALDRGDNATLTRYDQSAGSYLTVRAVEDWDHYGERPPGPMPLDREELPCGCTMPGPVADWERDLHVLAVHNDETGEVSL